MDQHEHPATSAEDKDLFRPDAGAMGDNTDAAQLAQTPVLVPEDTSRQGAALDDHAAKPEHVTVPAVTWTASEYITHSKSTGWYMALAAATVVIAAIIWLITRDFFPTTMVAIALLLLGIYAGRKPHEQSYALDTNGLTIGGRHYMFHDFRSFSVIREGAFPSIELTPLKRFAMYVTVYFDPKDEDNIAQLLSAHLPMEEPHANFTDSLMRQIRF